MITLRIDNQARLYPLNHLPGSVLVQIKERLAFRNPQWDTRLVRLGGSGTTAKSGPCLLKG